MVSIQWRRSAPVIIGVLCAITFAAPASASEPTKPSGAARLATPGSPEKAQRAAALYRDGVKAADAAKWLLAIEYFKASWDEYPHYQILMNLANAELMAERYRESAEHFDRALREHSSELSPSDDAIVRRRLAEARSHVGTIEVQVNVRGAALMLDQKVLDVTSASGRVFVDPGSRTLEAKLPGYVPARESLEVRAGQSYRVSLKLMRAAALTPPDTAPPEVARSEQWTTRLMIGGGVAAGIGAMSGGVFSVLSSLDDRKADNALTDLDKNHNSLGREERSECNAKNPHRAGGACDALGLRERQQLFATIAAWSFVAGGVGLAVAGLGLGLDVAGGVRVTATASSSGGGLLMVGNW